MQRYSTVSGRANVRDVGPIGVGHRRREVVLEKVVRGGRWRPRGLPSKILTPRRHPSFGGSSFNRFG